MPETLYRAILEALAQPLDGSTFERRSESRTALRRRGAPHLQPITPDGGLDRPVRQRRVQGALSHSLKELGRKRSARSVRPVRDPLAEYSRGGEERIPVEDARVTRRVGVLPGSQHHAPVIACPTMIGVVGCEVGHRHSGVGRFGSHQNPEMAALVQAKECVSGVHTELASAVRRERTAAACSATARTSSSS